MAGQDQNFTTKRTYVMKFSEQLGAPLSNFVRTTHNSAIVVDNGVLGETFGNRVNVATVVRLHKAR